MLRLAEDNGFKLDRAQLVHGQELFEALTELSRQINPVVEKLQSENMGQGSAVDNKLDIPDRIYQVVREGVMKALEGEQLEDESFGVSSRLQKFMSQIAAENAVDAYVASTSFGSSQGLTEDQIVQSILALQDDEIMRLLNVVSECLDFDEVKFAITLPSSEKFHPHLVNEEYAFFLEKCSFVIRALLIAEANGGLRSIDHFMECFPDRSIALAKK